MHVKFFPFSLFLTSIRRRCCRCIEASSSPKGIESLSSGEASALTPLANYASANYAFANHIVERASFSAIAIAWLCTLSLVSPAPAQASEVEGKIQIKAPGLPKRSEKHGAYLPPTPNGFLDTRTRPVALDATVTVVLTGPVKPGQGSASDAPKSCVYELRNGGMGQQAWAAKTGSAITIHNRDGLRYMLSTAELPGFRDIQLLAGGKRDVTVAQTGAFPLSDPVHPSVNGALHVFDDLVECGEIDASGRFVIRDVPNGAFTLLVLHQTKTLATKSLRLSGERKVNVGAIDLTISPQPSAQADQ